MEVAQECGARGVVSVLEGGYDLGALAACAVAHARGLMGKEFSLEPEPAVPEGELEAAAEAAAVAEEEEEVIAGLARLATGEAGEAEGK